VTPLSGIKGRVGFEAAAAPNHHQSAHLLENIQCNAMYWKEQLGNWYGMLFHEGQFLDP
jgi:argininosuccinate synthase